MRTPVLTTACLLGASLPLAAQSITTTSSPAGYVYQEGGGESRDVLGSEPKLRYQQIDSTLQYGVYNRNRISFRRDGRLFTNADYGARAIEIEIVMAEGDISSFGPTFASNYQGNVTTVVPKTRVQFPDWSQQPTQLPAAASGHLTIPFAQSWSYAGKLASGNDLLWEVRVHSNTQAGKDYPFDFQTVVENSVFGQLVPTRSGHLDLGRGCSLGARGEAHMDIDIWNFGTKFTLDAHLHTKPSAPVFMMLGFNNANLSLPGYCARIFVNPALGGIMFQVGISDPNGDMCIDLDPLPYHAALIGRDLYAQTVAPDASQPGVPVILSSGAKMTVSGNPRGPAVGRSWAYDPAAATAAVGPDTGGIIILLDQ